MLVARIGPTAAAAALQPLPMLRCQGSCVRSPAGASNAVPFIEWRYTNKSTQETTQTQRARTKTHLELQKHSLEFSSGRVVLLVVAPGGHQPGRTTCRACVHFALLLRSTKHNDTAHTKLLCVCQFVVVVVAASGEKVSAAHRDWRRPTIFLGPQCASIATALPWRCSRRPTLTTVSAPK